MATDGIGRTGQLMLQVVWNIAPFTAQLSDVASGLEYLSVQPYNVLPMNVANLCLQTEEAEHTHSVHVLDDCLCVSRTGRLTESVWTGRLTESETGTISVSFSFTHPQPLTHRFQDHV